MGIGFDLQRTLLWIVLLPLLGAVINGVAGRRANKNLVSAVAVGSVFGSFLLSLIGFGHLLAADDPTPITQTVYEWFSITVHDTQVPIQVRFVMDHLSGIMAVMVSGIGALIHVYSIGYMSEDPGYARFMTYLNLFMASMLILVLASSLPLLFVGWEGVGLCSYLLVGFWYENRDYAAAGRKAFVVNRIGDFGVLIGMFILVSVIVPAGAGHPVEAFEFSAINAAAPGLGSAPFMLGPVAIGTSVATLAVLFLFLGCTGKSAQIPLFVWLPDAMAGPTPVSALIHAATMVTAGVYLMVRLSPLVVESPFAMTVIAIVGALTALVAASIALVQNQMKKVLAYSTVSQLGFMFAAVGMGAFAGGFFHVFTHAFFKACLFLGAGSVMHAVHAHGDADIRYLGGLRKYLPKTHITFAIATIAIAGLPIFSGFFSKDEILLGAATWGTSSPYAPWVGWTVFGILVLAATMTAFYMFRLYFRTFWGEYKGGHAPEHEEHAHDEHAEDQEHAGPHHHHHVEPHESPDTMTVPLYVLAAGAAIVGFLGLPHMLHIGNWWSSWLTPQYEAYVETLEHAAASASHEEVVRQATDAAREVASSVAVLQFRVPGQNVPEIAHAPVIAPILAMSLGLLAALIGLGIAWLWYYKQNGAPAAALQSRMRGMHRVLMNKWYVDELYGATVVAFNKWLAVFAANLDRVVVDGILAKVSAAGAKASGFLLTRTQTGAVYAYAGMFVVGLAGLGWWFTYPHPDLRRVDDDTVGSVTWNAGRGLGYEYRWDFDSDGEWDTEWTTDAVSEKNYQSDGAAYYALAAIVELPPRVVSPVDVLGGDEDHRELVLEPGDDPVTVPVDGFVPYRDESEIEPTIAYRTVVRVNGQLPSELVPPAPEGESAEPRAVQAELSLVGANRTRLFGPETQRIQVSEDGSFSALLGANDSLRASLVGEGTSVRMSVDGHAVEGVTMEGGPRQVALLRINSAQISDNDGVRDGILMLNPGQSIPIGAARLTVAVRVRGTVEVRNPFGNLARSSEDVTLRIGREPAQTARLENAPEENAQ